MLVSISSLGDNWETLLLKADVKILSVTVSMVIERMLPGLPVLLFL